ncbi:DedA family protein [Pseudomonas sp.]|uniref:DedA family protein n=1 Tax=Pseudomonas sp. TaxID=306 RepID=UPI003D0AA818
MEFITLVIDFILHVDVHLAALTAEHGAWIYGILFLIIFCETGLVVTPFLPGDSLLFVAGAIATHGAMDVHLLVGLLIVAAILGDAVNYAIGRTFGHRAFRNPDSKVFRQSHLDMTQAFYARHGGKTIIFARFVPIVRTFAPFVAGMGRMRYSRFATYNVVGAIVWVTSFTYAGYFFGNLPVVKDNLHYLIMAIIVLSILPGVFEVVRRRLMASRASKA